MAISAKWIASVKDWTSSKTGRPARFVGKTTPCSWRMWMASWSVQWYITLRMSTWTAGGVLRFSCGGLARLQRLAVQHPTTTQRSTVNVRRSMAYHLGHRGVCGCRTPGPLSPWLRRRGGHRGQKRVLVADVDPLDLLVRHV